MHDFMLVAVVDGREELLHDLCGSSLRKGFFLLDPIEELPSRAQLCHNVEVFFVLIELIDFDDVWMILS
jgi:hypothetical protein